MLFTARLHAVRHRLPGDDMQALRKGVLHRDPFPLLLCIGRRGFPARHQRGGEHTIRTGRVSCDTPCCYLVITIIPAPQQPFLPLSYGSRTESSGLLPSAACGFLPFRRGCVPTRSVRRKPFGRSSAWRCAKYCHR